MITETAKGKRNFQDGFTILELMIGILIFTWGIMALMALQISSIKGNNTARQMTEATYLAMDQLERFMSYPYKDSDTVKTNDFISLASICNVLPQKSNLDTISAACKSTDDIYTVSWRVTDNGNETGTADVVVFWMDGTTLRSTLVSQIIAEISR